MESKAAEVLLIATGIYWFTGERDYPIIFLTVVGIGFLLGFG